MTGEVTTLLGEKAEKERMEQEMLAARDDPDEAAAAGAAARCRASRVIGVLRTGARGRRRLLRLPADHRHDARLPHRRRLGQGPRRRPLHGAAQGDRAVAGAPASRAARIADAPSTGWSRPISTPQLHHHELRRGRRRAAGDDLRARRPLSADPRARRISRPGCARRACWRPTAWSSACKIDDGTLFDIAAGGGDHPARAGRPGRALHRRHQRDDERERSTASAKRAWRRWSSSTRTCRSISCARTSWPRCARSPAAPTSTTT